MCPLFRTRLYSFARKRILKAIYRILAAENHDISYPYLLMLNSDLLNQPSLCHRTTNILQGLSNQVLFNETYSRALQQREQLPGQNFYSYTQHTH